MNAGKINNSAVLVDPDRSTLAFARPLLNFRQFAVFGARDPEEGFLLIESVEPQLVLIAHDPPNLDASCIARQLRMSRLAARKAPVIMMASQVSEGDILRARDSGVDEVLCKPFAVKDLTLRLDIALNKRRDWIEGVDYVGPDRRRFNSADNRRRRRADRQEGSSEDARIGQALKIMKAAIEAIDADPVQALRALHAQTDELQDAAVAKTDFALAGAAKTLREHLVAATASGKLSKRVMAEELNRLLSAPDARKAG